jgi:[ribosomal protein S5]-alanine N-acetyltransferase
MPKLIPPVVEPGTLAGRLQPTVEVDGELELRPFRRGDSTAVVLAFATPDIQRYHFRRMDDEGEAQRWIEDCADGWRSEKSATWAISEQSSGAVLGRVTIHLSASDGHGEVAYWVLPGARRRRVATRACVAATRWAHQLGLHRIQLEHSTRNEGSKWVASRAGFVLEGIRRGANLHADGWHDMVCYSHLSTDGW